MPVVKPVTLIALERTYDSKIRDIAFNMLVIVFNNGHKLLTVEFNKLIKWVPG